MIYLSGQPLSLKQIADVADGRESVSLSDQLVFVSMMRAASWKESLLKVERSTGQYRLWQTIGR